MLKKIVHNPTVLSLLMNGGSALAGLVTFALLSRSLGADNFGVWVLLLTTYSMLDLLRNGMIQNAFIKHWSEAVGAHKTGVYGSAIQVTIQVSTVLSGSVLLTWLVMLYFEILPEYQSLVLLLSLWIMVSWLFQFAQWAMLAFAKFKNLAIVRLSHPVLFLMLIVLFHTDEKGLLQLAILYGLALFLSSVLVLMMGWVWTKTWKRGSSDERNKLRSYGKYSMGTMVASHLLRSSDTFLIGAFLGTGAVGIYAVAFKFIELLEIPLRCFVQVFIPKMAQLSATAKDKAAGLYVSFAKVLTLLFLPIIIFMVVFPEFLVETLGGKQFVEAALVLQVLALFTLVLPLDRMSGVSLDMVNQPKINFQKVIIMLLVNAVGDYIALVYFESIVGVALVSTLTFTTGLIFGNWRLAQYLPIKATQFFQLSPKTLMNDFAKTIAAK